MLLQVRYLSDKIDVSKLKETFDSLSQDPYVGEKYRYKQIVRVICQDGKLVETRHGPLFQSSVINPTHGGYSRVYPELKLTNEIREVIREFVGMNRISDNEEILVQAQRIVTSEKVSGQPAVEGFHRDGVDWIGLFCVARENISGGISQFKRGWESPVYCEVMLRPGDMVSLDDRRNYHYATSITPVDSSRLAYRDMILLGVPACREG